MAEDKTAVEREVTKREPIGHSKTSLNPDSAHCIRSSDKNEKQQNNSIHTKSPKNSRTSVVFRKTWLREHQFGLYYRERNRARTNGLARLNEIMLTIPQSIHPVLH